MTTLWLTPLKGDWGYKATLRDWSLITGRGKWSFTPTKKKGGGRRGRKSFSHTEGGHKQFWGSFNTGAWSFSHSDGGGKKCYLVFRGGGGTKSFAPAIFHFVAPPQCPKLSFYFVHSPGALPIKLCTRKLLHAPSQCRAIINGSKNVHTPGAHLLKSCTRPWKCARRVQGAPLISDTAPPLPLINDQSIRDTHV